MQHPIELGNILLILVGAALVLSGPIITWRTIQGAIDRRRHSPTRGTNAIGDGLNLIIAVLFFLAGILFIINNLKGNPLA